MRTTISCRAAILFIIGQAVLLAAAASRVQPQPCVLPLAARWSVDIAGPPIAGASPISDDSHVYLALRSGHIVAHALADGQERWRKDLLAAHPLAADAGLLFVATDVMIHALRGEDGAPAWEAPAAITAPLVAHGGWVFALADGKVLAFRGSDGTRVWQRDLGAATERPAIKGDQLYVPLRDGRIVALDVSTGDQRWERTLGGAPKAPFATDDRLYVGAADRQFYCLDAVNGELAWQWRIGAAPQGSPAVDTSLVFVAALDNVLRAYDRRSGNQRWQHPLKRRPATGPVVLGANVLVPSSSSPDIWVWTTSGKAAGTIATPAEPAVAPEFVDRGAEGGFVFVVTGGLANRWQLTLLATAGDPPLEPLSALPGQDVELTW